MEQEQSYGLYYLVKLFADISIFNLPTGMVFF